MILEEGCSIDQELENVEREKQRIEDFWASIDEEIMDGALPSAIEDATMMLGIYLDSYKKDLNALKDACESPIEEIAAIDLYAASCTHISCTPYLRGPGKGIIRILGFESPIEYICRNKFFMGPDPKGFYYPEVLIQATFKFPEFTVRPDFAIFVDSPGHNLSVIFLEMDGHEFHENKVASARDKSRDRKLKAMGIDVYRFTGSEVWNNRTVVSRFLEFELKLNINIHTKLNCRDWRPNDGNLSNVQQRKA